MPKRRRQMDPEGKRTAILNAGEALFAARGYTRTTMADIAGAAGVAVGSVYRLFPDKPALLAVLHQQLETDFIAAMVAGWNSLPAYPDKFAPMIDAVMSQAADMQDRMPLYTMTQDMAGAVDYVPGARMIETIDRLYQEGQRAGAFRAFSPGVQAPIAHAMVEGGLRAWMADPTPARLAAIKRDLADLFRRAFLTE